MFKKFYLIFYLKIVCKVFFKNLKKIYILLIKNYEIIEELDCIFGFIVIYMYVFICRWGYEYFVNFIVIS